MILFLIESKMEQKILYTYKHIKVINSNILIYIVNGSYSYSQKRLHFSHFKLDRFSSKFIIFQSLFKAKFWYTF